MFRPPLRSYDRIKEKITAKIDEPISITQTVQIVAFQDSAMKDMITAEKDEENPLKKKTLLLVCNAQTKNGKTNTADKNLENIKSCNYN